MTTKISPHSIMQLKNRYDGLQKRLSHVKEKGEGAVKQVVGAVETSAGAFAFGAVYGRYGDVDVIGIPIDLGSGLVLHGAGMLGLAGKASGHLHAFGNGALASYFHTLGRGAGAKWAEKAGKPALKGDEGGRRLTKGDLDKLTNPAAEREGVPA